MSESSLNTLVRDLHQHINSNSIEIRLRVGIITIHSRVSSRENKEKRKRQERNDEGTEKKSTTTDRYLARIWTRCELFKFSFVFVDFPYFAHSSHLYSILVSTLWFWLRMCDDLMNVLKQNKKIFCFTRLFGLPLLLLLDKKKFRDIQWEINFTIYHVRCL